MAHEVKCQFCSRLFKETTAVYDKNLGRICPLCAYTFKKRDHPMVPMTKDEWEKDVAEHYANKKGE